MSTADDEVGPVGPRGAVEERMIGPFRESTVRRSALAFFG